MLLPLLVHLAGDEEALVRQTLAEQAPGLADALTAAAAGGCGPPGDEGYTCVLEAVLPLLDALLSDPVADVRGAAADSLVRLAGSVVRSGDLGQRVLTLALRLAHEDEDEGGGEELRMTAAALLNALCEPLGPELTLQFLLPEVECLAEDPSFRVRKAAALNLDALARVAGPANARARLLPCFKALCRDDIWGVRRACADALVGLSKALDPGTRMAELVPLFERFTTDPSKWVRHAAAAKAGPFIASLPGAKVSPALLALYSRVGMANASDAAAAAEAAASAATARSGGGIAQRAKSSSQPERRTAAAVAEADARSEQSIARGRGREGRRRETRRWRKTREEALLAAAATATGWPLAAAGRREIF